MSSGQHPVVGTSEAKQQNASFTSSKTSQGRTTSSRGSGVFSSYTRVSSIRSTQGAAFNRDDLALQHYDEARNTFSALEAGYKKLLLEMDSMKEDHKFKVTQAKISRIELLTIFSSFIVWHHSWHPATGLRPQVNQ